MLGWMTAKMIKRYSHAIASNPTGGQNGKLSIQFNSPCSANTNAPVYQAGAFGHCVSVVQDVVCKTDTMVPLVAAQDNTKHTYLQTTLNKTLSTI